MKTCKNCGTAFEDLAANFHIKRTKPDGNVQYMSECKVCRKAVRKSWYENNREHELERNKEWAKVNPEKAKAVRKANYEANKDRDNKRTQAYYQENKGYIRAWLKRHYNENKEEWLAHTRKRAVQMKLATPWWADKTAIKAIYSHAKQLTRETGITYEVDHIDPLQHPLVCGLHIPENMRVVPKSVNSFKHNKFNPYFTEPDLLLR